jgi:hypothetical protein
MPAGRHRHARRLRTDLFAEFRKGLDTLELCRSSCPLAEGPALRGEKDHQSLGKSEVSRGLVKPWVSTGFDAQSLEKSVRSDVGNNHVVRVHFVPVYAKYADSSAFRKNPSLGNMIQYVFHAEPGSGLPAI